MSELLEGKRDDTVIISRNSKSILKVHRLLLMIEVIFFWMHKGMFSKFDSFDYDIADDFNEGIF